MSHRPAAEHPGCAGGVKGTAQLPRFKRPNQGPVLYAPCDLPELKSLSSLPRLYSGEDDRPCHCCED